MFDVFKTLKIEEWKNATKEGDVKVNYDKSIAKNTVVIGGVTSASNYVSIPSSKGGASQSLNLVGKFVSLKSTTPHTGTFAHHGAKKCLFFILTDIYVYSQVYVLLCAAPNKNFVLHFEYMVNDTRVCRLSASNIYRELQFKNGTSIQIPLAGIVPNKWTVLQINAQHYL